MTLKGSCACGRVQYEIAGHLHGPLTYCHCWRCRKHSGSSFGTTAGVRKTELIFVSRHPLLRRWESSPGVYRYFASCCGSPIYKDDIQDPEWYGLRLGTLDTDPEQHVKQHYMVNAKAPWVTIDDKLECIAGDDPPFPERR